MLSIAQTDNGYYCFEWTPTEKGPRIDNYSLIKDNNCCLNNDFEKPISSFYKNNNQDVKSLAFILNSENVNINSITLEKSINLKDSIDWYESNILDENYLKSFELFYYPLKSKKNSQDLLVISLSKKIKNKIISLSKKYSYKLIYISIDFFSAYITAKQFYKISNKNKCLIWKIKKNNYHCFTLYENDCFSSMVTAKCNRDKYMINKTVGNADSINVIEDFISQTLVQKDYCKRIDDVYVYQTKMNDTLIKSYVNNKKINVKLLDISKIFNFKNKNPYQLLQYVENGISLKGIDV